MKKLDKALNITKKRLLIMGISLLSMAVILLAIGFIGLNEDGAQMSEFVGFFAMGLLFFILGFSMTLITFFLLLKKKNYMKLLGVDNEYDLNKIVADMENTKYERGRLWLGENNVYFLGRKAKDMCVPYEKVDTVQYKITTWRYNFLIPIFKEHELEFFNHEDKTLGLMHVKKKDLDIIEDILTEKNVDCYF
ncbi:hypothetical protein [Breznakia pachnodae]|uniref:Uncharacterized protein n=1 Tax=Breznakia pachnodae TaxID=265178 RepID=A0ABU0E4S8_9FIRM|nr:hypothetical protein [Breznakia pachnodae]MDQ0361505.1 hypothetical protein [Breznakia pachnodae]